MLNNWQERTEMILGEKHQNLKDANVLIVGLGGVGAVTAEMLCRAGIEKMTIVDGDIIDITNLNRQIFTSQDRVGQSKAFVLAEKLMSINPNLKLNVVDKYLKDSELVDVLKSDNFDYVVDAIDTIAPKVFLIYNCVSMGLPVVTSMGAGGKLNPTLVQVDDIAKSYNCQLARIVRKRLHRLGVRTGVKAVFSTEKRIDNALKFVELDNKKSVLGTISYMPAIFGLYCAWVVIDDLTHP